MADVEKSWKYVLEGGCFFYRERRIEVFGLGATVQAPCHDAELKKVVSGEPGPLS